MCLSTLYVFMYPSKFSYVVCVCKYVISNLWMQKETREGLKTVNLEPNIL